MCVLNVMGPGYECRDYLQYIYLRLEKLKHKLQIIILEINRFLLNGAIETGRNGIQPSASEYLPNGAIETGRNGIQPSAADTTYNSTKHPSNSTKGT